MKFMFYCGLYDMLAMGKKFTDLASQDPNIKIFEQPYAY